MTVAFKPSDGELFARLNRGERIDLARALKDLEYQLIDTAMRRTGGVKSQAAHLLSINRTTLIEKLRHQRGQNRDRP